jgi:glycosyltransferase involved in cell wall biosynthesis
MVDAGAPGRVIVPREASVIPALLCLNMIVKNESAIIERCLRSIAPVIAYYVICDTGSTDDTRARIEKFFAALGIPGEIHDIAFNDFAQARNEALACARASPGVFDYLLFADADMELTVTDPRFCTALTASAYQLKQHGEWSYWNTRLLKRTAAGRYIGATHEYLEHAAVVERLTGVSFVDHACGANRENKLARDIALLRAAVESNPGDVRAMFYLAQSYRDGGNYAAAREWYVRRVESGGWDEEVWCAMLMRARCDLALGDDVGFVDGCLSAYNFRPTRAEPLAELARYYREHEQHEVAMLWCEVGKAIPYPDGDILFVDDRVYSYGFVHEMSIAGFYSKDGCRRRAAHEAVLELQLRRDIPADVRAVARRNGMFYAPTATLFGMADAAALELPMEAPYVGTNPSLWLDSVDLRCVIRGVNYRLTESWYVLPDDGVIRTRNYLARLGRDGRILDAAEMVAVASVAPPLATGVRGFEDCRLFRWRDRLHCLATVRDRNAAMRCEIALLDIDGTGSISRVRTLTGYGDDLDQKNWMPAVDGECLFLIYLCDPTIVLRYDPVAERLREHATHIPTVALEHLRGGSQAIRFDEGWLCLTHEVIAIDATHRRYLHRFVLFDRTFHVVALTEPFRFGDNSVEFAAGLAHDRARDVLLVSYGVQDCKAMVATLDATAVRQGLVRVPG